MYEDGKVCVSLLGTWSGKGTETWTPNSNMLQLLVSIQGLILVPEVRRTTENNEYSHFTSYRLTFRKRKNITLFFDCFTFSHTTTKQAMSGKKARSKG